MAASVDSRPFNHLKASPMGSLTRCTPRVTNRVIRPDSSTQPVTHQQGGYASSDDEETNDPNLYIEMTEKAKAYRYPTLVDPRDGPTADRWVPRDPAMVRLTGKHPFNAEAPMPRLMKHGFITPVPLHYVRNHGAVPRVSWEDWTVEVTGLVKRPGSFSMDRLVSEFASREFPVTLVCAGNRRKEQNMVKQSIGFNWGAGGVSTSVWRGVRLCDVLKRCGIMSRKNGALQVCFEGAEDLPGGGGSKYGTSIRREIAMDPANDIILAYMQNGELLAPDHGFPVRVIVPGHIGGRMVKWVKKIIVTNKESHSYYHFMDNRVLPSHIDAELANTEAWWYKPEYMINELNTNSVITSPRHEEILPINSTTQRPFTLKGYSYSGGGKKVTRVEVTMDGGDTWHVCKLDHPEKPNRYGKYWCWCFWSIDVEVLDLIGAKEIAVRAWDQSHNTQPEKLIWNLMGMMNNCWFRVKINVCKPHRGEIGIVFEHPTQPGNQSGGWMAKERYLEESSTDPTLKKSLSTPFMTTSTQTFTLSEVKKHDSPDSAWIVVHGHVYDCTGFLKDHPGGTDGIIINAGSDCTEEFVAIHSDRARNLLEKYRIGELLVNTESDSDSASPGSTHHGPEPKLDPIGELVGSRTALVPGQKIPCKLISKVSISHDVRVFRFGLPSEDQTLGLPTGKHVFLCAVINEKLCMRAYTPITGADTVGYFELVIKIYVKNVHPRFPTGGLLTQYLDSIPIGSTIDVKGPLGHIEYSGRGMFMVKGKQQFARKLAMVAGGTGITPIYQVVQAVLKDPEDRTEMFVVYANRTEDDILLRDDLDRWAEEHGDRLKVWYVVQESVKDGWEFSVGFITEDILRDHVPEGSDDVLALVCGPPPMVQFAVQPSLEKLNYDTKESLLVF